MGHESDGRRTERVAERARKVEAQHQKQAIQQAQSGTPSRWRSAAAETTLAIVPSRACRRHTCGSVNDKLLVVERGGFCEVRQANRVWESERTTDLSVVAQSLSKS
jgi:hypothetical protein